MSNKQTTTKTTHYFRAVLMVLAVLAALLVTSRTALASPTTFSNSAPVQVADNDKANPYPSQINVQNLSGTISDVNVRLFGYSHPYPDDVDVLLVGPKGQKALLMSDAGGSGSLDSPSVDLGLDDEASKSIPDDPDFVITSGSFRPTQGTPGTADNPVPSSFPSPAPAGPYARNLSVFDGTDPNGTWSLYVLDDTAIDSGQFAGGWSLQITTGSTDTQPQTFTVDSTADTGDATTDGKCGSPCTLREAIQEANANFNPNNVDRIDFGISGTGVHTISPGSRLPRISEPVAIDGYSQQGSSENTLAKGTNAKPLIELDGTGAGSGASGLEINAKNTVVKGLVINRFGFSGIGLVGAAEANGARIEGNFVGTNPAGTLALPNKSNGVVLAANSDVVIGGTSAASRNLISANQSAGVLIVDSNTGTNNKVRGNLIGTDKSGTGNLGNGASGVIIRTGAGYSVVSNTIAFNGAIGGTNATDGIALLGDDGSTGNRFLSNSIFSNAGLGIDLPLDGPNTNDNGDTDPGANGKQNKPSLGSAKTVSGKTTIKGQLNSSPGATYTVQFFSNPSGNEGKTFIGQRTGLAVDGTGHASFTFSPSSAVAVGQTITATATNEVTKDTSEFSAPKTVASS